MTRAVDRAQMVVSTTGDGSPVTLGAATVGFRSFAAAGLVDGDRASYLIQDANNAWEIGEGIIDGSTITREVKSSSNGDERLVLTGAAVISVIHSASDIEQVKDDLAEMIWYYR